MEARRRINLIAGHFTATDDVSAATHVFPMNCTSSLNTVIQRRDNRMSFARQGSSSQASFMRPVSIEQGSSAQPLKCSGSANERSSIASEAPSFSRPARMEPKFQNVGPIQPVTQDCKLASPDPPKFARPNRKIVGQKQFHSEKEMLASKPHGAGSVWSPRMDVTESGRNYVVMFELPGVGINGVRVEINDRNLIVKGKRSTQWWKVEGYSKGSSYHKREISQGPFQVVWPLPANVNKDKASAEFVNGFLQITLPKL